MGRRQTRTGPVDAAHVRTVVGTGVAVERAVRARVEALAGVTHPGVCVPVAIERDGAAVVVVSPLVTGPTAAELTGAGIDVLGEWVWTVSGIARGLAAMHRAGIAHGDVSPANVVIERRPVLVDTVGGGLGLERGTPGFASPERGARATTADDVHALGMLGRALAAPGIRRVVEAWTAPLIDPDPGLRPSAEAVARGVIACATPVPWRRDPPTVAGRARPVATEKDPHERLWRARRLATARATVVGGAAVMAAVAGTWFAWPLVDPAGASPARAAHDVAAAPSVSPASSLPPASSSARASSAGPGEPPADRPEPAAAARELTAARVTALAAGDAEALVPLTVPGSAAWTEATRAARLTEAGAQLDGATVTVTGTRVLERDGDAARVEIAYELSGYVATDAAGSSVAVPATDETVVLELAWSGDEWRVVSAAPVSGGT